ncbi:SET domain-containing protein-lysine N-methyltransferase [Paenalcaligenes niemegkensis]|nr:SET domain-containing protein-lysine N-methyltransferase [Paenalcaligenes niemegkensis]MCQ9617882.1 SET domain-containing protein-lysine N-methyltransferase [Paenalcaligenes niemegkensis]
MALNAHPWHELKQSSLHGTGVFAARHIPAGTYIMEYEGKRISAQAADEMEPSDPNDPYHTFFFSLTNGKIIDGGNGGNDSRFINHSCEPNCEGHENAQGTRVYIVALRNIDEGEELLYDYALTIDDEITATLKSQYACLCGAESCRGTMLALPDAEASEDADIEKVSSDECEKKQAKRLRKLKKRMRKLEKKIDRLIDLLDDPKR